jgi:hypothetical protein
MSYFSNTKLFTGRRILRKQPDYNAVIAKTAETIETIEVNPLRPSCFLLIAI